HHPAHRADQEPGGGQRHQEQRRRPARLDERADRPHPHVPAQGVEGPARQVEDALDAEDHLQAGGDEKEDGGVEDAAHHDAGDAGRHARGAYSTTRSARLITEAGTGRPKAGPFFWFPPSSKVAGRSTGMSAGFAPCRMRPTKPPARRNDSRRLRPKAMRPPPPPNSTTSE